MLKSLFRSRGAFAALALVLGACDDPAVPIVDSPDPALDATELWFVELEVPPVIQGGARARIRDQHAAFLADAALAGLTVESRYRMTGVWNGISIRVPHGDVGRLWTLPGVRGLFPVVEIAPPQEPPQPTGAAPDLASSVGMIGGDIAHDTLGLTGAGVRVGIIDTGIDYDHPDLGGCFGPGCRVAVGTDFVGDNFNADVPGTVAVPDDAPDDCAGHGSHVAGIVGANGAVVGVAPEVTFGAYRVFGCAGSTTADVMLAAMDAAYADDMRVINISIGSPFTWPEYPTATAVTNLVEHGVVVATSIGNSGTSGLYAAGAPGIGADSIGVASIDNASLRHPALQITPSTAIANNGLVAYTSATAAPTTPTSGSAPLVRTGMTNTVDDACPGAATQPAAGSLTGKIALIRRGTCNFYQKAAVAQSAGAIGVVLYNNALGDLAATVAGTPPISIPVVGITSADGIALNSQLDLGPASLTWTTSAVSTPNPTGGQVSSTSSWGPSAELTFKPNLAAPGGSVYSTYPLELGGYSTLSGTSMAAPHVAGAAALLIQGRPGVTAREVATLLTNTAVPVSDPLVSALFATQRQGAGMIHVDAAATTALEITPSTIALGESTIGPQPRTLTLRNTSTTDTITIAISHRAATSVAGTTWAPLLSTTGAASVGLSDSTLALGPGESKTITATITANPALAAGGLYGGYLTFTPDGGRPVLSVPYQGYAGDYQAKVVLVPTPKGYPWLARFTGTYVNQPAGSTFTLAGADVPIVLVHLEHFARRLRIDMIETTTGKPVGTLVDDEFVSHAGTATETAAYRFTGTVTVDKQPVAVANGTYRFKLSVLKALGDEATPADWETWVSPVVTLDHP